MKKRWIGLAILVAVGAGSAYHFHADSGKKAPLPLVKAGIGTINKQAVAIGQIVPAHSVQIKSQIDGIVGKIYHQVGDYVTAGTPLIKINPNPTPISLTQVSTSLMTAKAQLFSAKQSVANFQRLLDEHIIPANYGQYVQAQANLKQAEAQYEQSQQNLNLIRSGVASVGKYKLTSTVSAPINGIILNLQVEVGEPIISTESNQSATPLMSLADMNNLIFKGSVSEQDASHLKVGMPARLVLAPYPNAVITGTLSQVGVQSEALNGIAVPGMQSFDNAYEVQINHIHFPKTLILRSGFSSTAQILLEQAKDVVTVPERILQFNGNQAEVLVPNDSAQGYRLQPVELGLSNGIDAQVIKGVTKGETLVDASQLGGKPNA
jgi:HlyD family secretion protein